MPFLRTGKKMSAPQSDETKKWQKVFLSNFLTHVGQNESETAGLASYTFIAIVSAQLLFFVLAS
jgi:hypothetical protein